MVITGKLRPYCFPVFGSTVDGPVLPIHPPRTLLHITKKILVSIILPGPIRISHQPFFLVRGLIPEQN